MCMVWRPYGICLKVGIDWKRSDQLLSFSQDVFLSLVLNAIAHREAIFFPFFLSLSLTVLLIKELLPKVALIL